MFMAMAMAMAMARMAFRWRLRIFLREAECMRENPLIPVNCSNTYKTSVFSGSGPASEEEASE